MVHDAAAGTSVVSGIKDLIVMNTTASEFWGFPKDAYTTLAETKDRILATAVNASWRFRPEAVGRRRLGARRPRPRSRRSSTRSRAPTRTRCSRCSTRSARPCWRRCRSICEVRLALPNKHHFIVDLAPFGLENDREVYHADDRPYGLIEGTRAGRRRPGGRPRLGLAPRHPGG